MSYVINIISIILLNGDETAPSSPESRRLSPRHLQVSVLKGKAAVPPWWRRDQAPQVSFCLWLLRSHFDSEANPWGRRRGAELRSSLLRTTVAAAPRSPSSPAARSRGGLRLPAVTALSPLPFAAKETLFLWLLLGQVWGTPRVGSGATTAGEQEGSPPLRPKAVQQYRARLARATAPLWWS